MVTRWAVLVVASACGRIGFSAVGSAGGIGRDGGATGDGVVIPTNANLVFVTSTREVLGAIGGLAAADALCQTSASGAGLPGTYVAWISTSTVNAQDRLAAARAWIRPDGMPFADTVADIVAGEFAFPINVDEYGTAYEKISDGPALTNTTSAGIAQAGSTCSDLTSMTGSAIYGTDLELGSAWTQVETNSCAGDARLYCFGIDHDDPLPAPPPVQRYAFVTKGTVTSGNGVAVMDALCASEASTAGLPGSYLALVATTTTAAGSRFTAGAPWARPDGAIVTTAFEQPRTPVDEAADGTLLGSVYVWTGAGDWVSTAYNNCTDFTDSSSAQFGYTGYTLYAGLPALDIASQACSAAQHVYCFER